MRPLLSADGLIEAGFDEESWPAFDRANLLRVLVEIGVSAIQFEGDGRLNIYARVNPGDPLL